jgi:hypothetical protein
MNVWAAIAVKWVHTGECIATVRQVAIATWIADDTVSEGIETGNARTEIGLAGVPSMKTGPGDA